MLSEISYYPIFGKPLIMYLGILTISSFLFTASIVKFNIKGPFRNFLDFHNFMARVSIGLAVAHGALGVLFYL